MFGTCKHCAHSEAHMQQVVGQVRPNRYLLLMHNMQRAGTHTRWTRVKIKAGTRCSVTLSLRFVAYLVPVAIRNNLDLLCRYLFPWRHLEKWIPTCRRVSLMTNEGQEAVDASCSSSPSSPSYLEISCLKTEVIFLPASTVADWQIYPSFISVFRILRLRYKVDNYSSERQKATRSLHYIPVKGFFVFFSREEMLAKRKAFMGKMSTLTKSFAFYGNLHVHGASLCAVYSANEVSAVCRIHSPPL